MDPDFERPIPVAGPSSRFDIPTTSRPLRKRRRIQRDTTDTPNATVAFALSLCLPYVDATPLPTANLTSTMTATRSVREAGVSLLNYTARHVTRYLIPRDNGNDPPTMIRPIMAAAEVDHNGKWVIPSGYVILVQQFKPGVIILSYVIAFVGSLCTLELLVRRTNNAGWRNRLLLTAAGVCFGGVSTFAMHFVFNNSLSLHHPMQDLRMYPSLYLQYDAGFTVLSLVASITAMTLAFFIMGSDMQGWWCFPGKRRRRAEKSSRNGGDEYGKWKKTHKAAIRGGELGVGALMETAGRVAKWSMVDSGEKRTWSNLSKKARGPKAGEAVAEQGEDEWKMYGDGQVMKRDKELEELEFRLGKEAVMLELERRNAPTPTSTTNDSISNPGNYGSHATMPSIPQPIFNPSMRRGSLPADHNHHEMFTPGFAFGSTRSVGDPNDSSTALLHDGPPPWTTDSGFEPYRRRASLPTSALANPSPLATRQPATLARIQSLPEPDQSPPSSRRPSDKDPKSPTLSVNAHLSTIGTELPHHAPRNSPTLRVFGKIERFLGFDVVTIGDIVKIFITGTIAGFGVAGMHYIGQASITGMPYIAYRPEYVVGSVIIASSAVCIALYIMFIMLRPKLKHTLWSKLAVAVILAAAVCLMHYTGMRGTVYGWPRDQAISRQSQLTGTNAAIVGVVVALAFAACVGCAVFFAVSSWSKRRERRRRRRVVIAAIFLDQHDRVLVNSTDGMLPMCDIASLTGDNQTGSKRSSHTGSTNSSALGMDLSAGHDAFVSALKMSWSWRSGAVANPAALTSEAIKTQIAVNSAAAEIRRGSQITMQSADSRPVRLSIAKFLEMFGNAAAQLAVTVTGSQQGITRLGVLYDQILTTGWVKLNNSNDTVSKGQLVFLVRRVSSSQERSDLLARHYIFADATAVAHTIHKSLSVPLEHTVPLLQDISHWCDSTARSTLKPNTLYGGVAVVQATPFDGLRILLEKKNRSHLPMRELCNFATTPSPATGRVEELSGTVEEIGEALTWLEGMSLLSVITRNMIIGEEFVGGPRVGQLLSILERAIVPMLDSMLTAEDMSHVLPRLTLHPMLVPLTPGGSASSTTYTPPYLIVFYANYDAAVNTFTDQWLPFSLFRAQNASVMAGHIASAARHDRTQPLPVHEQFPLIGNGDYTRRPSRVQFDFPTTSGTGSASSIDIASTKPPLPDAIPTTGLFSGLSSYSFPPRNPDQDFATGPPQPQPTPTPTSLPAHMHPRLGRNGSTSHTPTRSSLAKVSRFDQPSADEYHNNGIPQPKTGEFSGVGEWDPDWLLVLLRSKLRAEA